MLKRLIIQNNNTIKLWTNENNQITIDVSKLITHNDLVLKDNNGVDIIDLDQIGNKNDHYDIAEITNLVDVAAIKEKTPTPKVYYAPDSNSALRTSIDRTMSNDYERYKVDIDGTLNVSYRIYSDILDIQHASYSDIFFYIKSSSIGSGILSVTAIRDGMSPSDPLVLPVTVSAYPEFLDSALYYHKGNIDDNFLNGNGITHVNGVLVNNNNVHDGIDILDTNEDNTATIIYLNVPSSSIEIGDTFIYDENGNTFTVATIDENSGDCYVSPVETLVNIPTKAILVKHEITSTNIHFDQDQNDPYAFNALRDIYVVNKIPTILDENNASTVDKLYINRKSIYLEPGDKYVTDNGEEITISNFNGVFINKVFRRADNVFAILSNGETWCVGGNVYGQLGIDSAGSANAWVNSPIDNVYNISLAYNHTLALKNDGTVWGCGNNGNGELTSTASSTNISWVDLNITDVRYIYAGGQTSVVIKNNGEVWCCGYNGNYVFGNSVSNGDITEWTNISLTGIEKICTNTNHSIALKNDGTVIVSGSNSVGQLGLGDSNNRNNWVDAGMSNITDVFNSTLNSGVVDSDGNLWVAGFNGHGQLGLGDNNDRDTFIKSNIDNVAKAAISLNDLGTGVYSVVIKKDNTVWATGSNAYGQLGSEVPASTSDWIQLNVPPARDIVIGETQLGIIGLDGMLYSAGTNTYSSNDHLIKTGVSSYDYPGFYVNYAISVQGDYYTDLNSSLSKVPNAIYPVTEYSVNGIPFVKKGISYGANNTIVTHYEDIDLDDAIDITTKVIHRAQTKTLSIFGKLYTEEV